MYLCCRCSDGQRRNKCTYVVVVVTGKGGTNVPMLSL